ncbi:MAG: precorrin-6A/cobalt-precorrin-6A reductase [Pseudomonadota bacterium]
MTRLLILGGTAEARALALKAAALPEPADISVTLSLAGVTRAPPPLPLPVRRGGFGGADGLAAHLRATDTTLLICATHPFACQMPQNARRAAAAAAIPLLRLLRPGWQPGPGDLWHWFPTVAAAVSGLPSGAHALMTTGAGTSDLPQRHDVALTLRSIEPPVEPPPGVDLLIDRPPYALEGETALMRARGISHLITRDAGGADRARLDAARTLGLPVHLIARPPVLNPGIKTVPDVASAMRWIAARLG